MTSWTRILQSPASRRTSSYFSSKAGGGRYFNSTKPLSAPAAPKKSSNVDRPDSPSNGSGNQAVKATEEPSVVSSSSRRETLARSAVTEFAPSTHPVIGDKDFKLHQFFSLHRPLLLLSNPPSIMYSSPPTSIFSLTSPPSAPASSPEISPETAAVSDAEAARTLSRAMTMNRAGATTMWEETLKRIGLDMNLEPERVGLQERLDKELQEVRLDSTKRKKRKKMKKHKLKKRRRLTRQQRLKTR
ncbi:hypothetical protein GYMLUDRAFT_45800 [Collybiopsis luxurians FD-317 M1]|uniref:Ribosomal protein mS38 C-terminal domain-containing protein n=1 Tax=Collybiopsis luxurians FD-317 M1 TaxID=944289 RepID=A0A0D0CQE1_9AGAR|nr:hypothetical protein GYMLUDRAFT_45800 [Collybiopsis luxurians FD-317 M1]